MIPNAISAAGDSDWNASFTASMACPRYSAAGFPRSRQRRFFLISARSRANSDATTQITTMALPPSISVTAVTAVLANACCRVSSTHSTASESVLLFIDPLPGYAPINTIFAASYHPFKRLIFRPGVRNAETARISSLDSVLFREGMPGISTVSDSPGKTCGRSTPAPSWIERAESAIPLELATDNL